MATKKKPVKKTTQSKTRAPRRFTEKQEKWRMQYMTQFFGCIEPCMLEDDFREGRIKFREYAEANLEWMRDHASQIIGNLYEQIP